MVPVGCFFTVQHVHYRWSKQLLDLVPDELTNLSAYLVVKTMFGCDPLKEDQGSFELDEYMVANYVHLFCMNVPKYDSSACWLLKIIQLEVIFFTHH